jgi:hypothetical protein
MDPSERMDKRADAKLSHPHTLNDSTTFKTHPHNAFNILDNHFVSLPFFMVLACDRNAE